MNKEKILAVADAIEARSIEGLGFDMDDFWGVDGECGTIACIAGWACALEYGLANVTSKHVFYSAKAILGLTEDQANWLFFGDWTNTRFGDITIDEAVAYLRVYAS